jgi:serine protease Do
MGFAIPIEDAVNYANEIISGKSIERPLLGVGTLDVSNTQGMYQYGFSIDKTITEGAVVGYIQKGSPADDAKLEKGDVITKFGDYDIKSSSYLKYYLYKYNVGDKVKVTYIRGTKTYTTTVTLDQKAS